VYIWNRALTTGMQCKLTQVEWAVVAESGGAGGILGRRCITKSYYALC